MEQFNINVIKDKSTYEFKVVDYVHHDGEQCKFEVFHEGRMVVSFEPDAHEYLRICKNPGILDKDIIHLIADKIESYHL